MNAVFKRPEHVPGLHNATPARLIHTVDTLAAPTALERALADALQEADEALAYAEKERDEAFDSCTNAEAERDAARAECEEAAEAADTFRELLVEAAAALVGDTLREVEAALARHPSKAEIAAQDREREAAIDAAIQRAREEIPGFVEAWLAVEAGKRLLVAVSYKVPRGRKWHDSSHSFYLGRENVRLILNQAERLVDERPGVSVCLRVRRCG